MTVGGRGAGGDEAVVVGLRELEIEEGTDTEGGAGTYVAMVEDVVEGIEGVVDDGSTN